MKKDAGQAGMTVTCALFGIIYVALYSKGGIKGGFIKKFIFICNMDNIFNVLTGEYDAWYDSEDGKPLYESELLCLKPLVENCISPILEIGVGTGRFAKCFPGTIGIDPAFNALRLAQQRGVQVVQAVGEMLPFKDETFGCVLLIVTLCFVQNPVHVLSEAKRVLKQDGSIIIGLIPKDSPWGIFYEEKKRQGHPFYGEATFYSLPDMEKLLEETGMMIMSIRSTLLQRPDEPRRIEEPVESYSKIAGFLCIEAKIKYNP
ncbi:MAG: class I SAM-dependent methyltransferase [Thermodesulfovibrionales bacterium]|nr:class I SAM-dependent methyltransferase [Thermodesulfovibrionales bacterium]